MATQTSCDMCGTLLGENAATKITAEVNDGNEKITRATDLCFECAKTSMPIVWNILFLKK